MTISKPLFKSICWVVFILYLLTLIKFTFFETQIDHVTYRYQQLMQGRTLKQNFRISNWVPGIAIWSIINSDQGLPFIVQNLVGNIIGFVPMGVLIAILFTGARSYSTIAAAGLIISGSIETTQLLAIRGYFDVDDIILNTFGVVIGYYLFCKLLIPLAARLKLSYLFH